MNDKDDVSVLRLQGEHLQKLVASLTAKLATLEQAVAVDDSFDVLPPTYMAEVERLSRYIVTEAERLRNYIDESTLDWGGAQPQGLQH
jgi:hypothetical protein